MNLFDLPKEEPKAVEKPKSKKQPATPKQIPATVKKCGDCSHGEFLSHFGNFDLNGKPINLKCPFKEFHIGRFENGCEKFKQK